MSEQRLKSRPLRFKESRREAMLEPEEVSAMLRLKELGWGTRRIARELGVSRNTVKNYIEAGGWMPYQQPARKKRLDGEEAWLKERFSRHRGNADVIRQELAAEKEIFGQSSDDRAGGAAVSAGTRGGVAGNGAL